MYGLYYFDYSYFLFMLPALILSLYAQIKVSSTFAKYSKIKNSNGLTGSEAAYKVLAQNGVTNVAVEHISGSLNDHFDPQTNIIRLSDSVYSSNSVAAVGVAAHEAGHAVQYANNYAPMKFRRVLVPITNIGSTLSIPLIFIGLLLPIQYDFIVNIGIALFSFAVLFQLVTLPVEFDASRRAITTLEQSGTLYDEELIGAKKVLSAAAMTYLAATFSAVMSLFRLILIAGNRRGRD
ncbi:putative neutral zinc metallopeptidase [Clostridium sp. CAG:557]|jgi:Zn-dependent membrane protease YugP|nr:putative neutral zinc metallopeptidase [Clostridium sp. CAG:557]